MLLATNFQSNINGDNTNLYTIENENIQLHLTNFGARIVALKFGEVDVVCGFDSIEKYQHASEQYHGATVGRVANRISHGRFILDDQQYDLAKNIGEHTLHGGVHGFHKKVWQVKEQSPTSISFFRISPHLEENFPGNLKITVKYTLVEKRLSIEYFAETDQKTIVNLTNHAYWNLNGEGSGEVLEHTLELNANSITTVDHKLIPNGKISLVYDTPLDFTVAKTIGKDLNLSDPLLSSANGYDHNFVINNHVADELGYAATVKGDISGITMKTWTTEPGVQFYTANHFDHSDVGKSGNSYGENHAFCLETQHFPDAPNQPAFPSISLFPDKEYCSRTDYIFGMSNS